MRTLLITHGKTKTGRMHVFHLFSFRRMRHLTINGNHRTQISSVVPINKPQMSGIINPDIVF
jgi:hypothetical protein